MAELETGTAASRRPRPISPHLQIYKPMLTMMMSIVHRGTGAALYFGMLLLAWWLIAAASGPNAYANVEWFMGSLIGRLILLGYTWALLHHALGGIRVEPVPVPADCRDGFFAAYWARPEAYLDPTVRAGISCCAPISRSRRRSGCCTAWPTPTCPGRPPCAWRSA